MYYSLDLVDDSDLKEELDEDLDVEDEYKRMFNQEKIKREDSKKELTERDIASLGEEALNFLKKGGLTQALTIYQNSIQKLFKSSLIKKSFFLIC